MGSSFTMSNERAGRRSPGAIVQLKQDHHCILLQEHAFITIQYSTFTILKTNDQDYLDIISILDCICDWVTVFTDVDNRANYHYCPATYRRLLGMRFITHDNSFLYGINRYSALVPLIFMKCHMSLRPIRFN